MKFIIDDANVAKVKEIWDLYPCDGVTTNPSILAKSGRNPYDVLKELREIVGEDGELHVQVVSKDAEGMMKEAAVIREKLGGKYIYKNSYHTSGAESHEGTGGRRRQHYGDSHLHGNAGISCGKGRGKIHGALH